MNRQHLAAVLALALAAGSTQAAPWSYRGTLNDNGKPANGRYDIRLTLLDVGGKRVALNPVTFLDVPVTNGTFAVEVEFGADLANAPAMKLRTEVGERGGAFVEIGEPSHFDAKSVLAGVCWDTQGNAGTNAATDFIGTLDTQALNFRVNNTRRLVVDSRDNHVAGAAVNAFNAAGDGQTIAGGGSAMPSCGIGGDLDCRNQTTSSYATVGGGAGNIASGQLTTVGGGSVNRATQNSATVAGGFDNTASASNAAILGGFFNRATGEGAVVGGGYGNEASARYAFVAGGSSNTASNEESSVAGGAGNGAAGRGAMVAGGNNSCAGGDYSFAAGNYARVRVGNEANDGFCAGGSGDEDGDEGAFVWADASSGNAFQSTGPNQFAVRAVGGLRWSGTGPGSTTSPAFIHQMNTATNACDGGSGANTRTVINHPLLNGNPNAVLVITPNFGLRGSGTSPPLNVPLGIYYNDTAGTNCALNRWVVYQLTTGTAQPINNGARFNIWFVLP